MLRALAAYLHGEDFPLLGVFPTSKEPLWRAIGATVNALPRSLREQVYIWSGWFEALPERRIDQFRADEVAEWVVDLYAKRRYPAVAIGSSNGAAMHLFAALGIPWLPQTFLLPVRRSGPRPDEPGEDLEWAKEPSRIFLERNPDVSRLGSGSSPARGEPASSSASTRMRTRATSPFRALSP